MLCHVFIYHSTSLQIFLFYKFFCTNISTILRSSHRRCSIRKLLSQTFCDIHRLKAIRPVAILKRDSNTDILNCQFRGIYKNTYFEKKLANSCIFGKCSVRIFFKIRNQQKEFLKTSSMKGCSNQSKLNKYVSYNKVQVEERKD